MWKRLLMTTALAAVSASGAYAEDAAPPSVDALAPNADANGRVVYEPAFFARYAPSTALDMVNRVPGFSIDEGEDRRGFSGAAGNVLIDGEQPSSKSDSLQSILARIPADQVVRVELLRGASGEGGNQATLVNVVRAPSSGSGVWEAEGEYNIERNRFAPRGSLSWNGRIGDFEYGAGVSRFLQYRNLHGERIYTDALGAYTGRRDDISPRSYRETVPTAQAAFPLLGGRMRLNAQWQRWEFESLTMLPGFDPSGAQTDDLKVDFWEREQSGELGMNFTRSFGPLGFELVGLLNRAHYAQDQGALLDNPVGVFASATEQLLRQDKGESILRGVATWTINPRHRLQFGIEGAYNSLEQTLALTEDSGGGPAAIVLPSANVLVEESRAEGFLTYLWRPADGWSIESTLAAETSTLTQTGDVALETTLTYVKPSLQITRTFGRNQARLRIYRDVGQLDFGDFVSAASLADALVGGGNPNLRPETSWRAELSGDLRFGTDGALGLTLFHWEIEDASDVVPVTTLSGTFDAPGNIGTGSRDGVKLSAALPLTAILPGARLTLDGTFQRGEVTDPVTLRARTISELFESEVSAEFRQDLTAAHLAWGLSFYKASQYIVFRRNEIDTPEEGPFLDVYAEYTGLPGVKLKLTAANVFDGDVSRERLFFDPDRNGAFQSADNRLRHLGPFFIVTLSGTF